MPIQEILTNEGESTDVVVNPKQENMKKRTKREDYEYYLLNDTKKIKMRKGHIAFCKNFKYLGSYISYSMKYDYDIQLGLISIKSAMGKL